MYLFNYKDIHFMRYLRVLESIDVYREHEVNSWIIGTLEVNQIIRFNREKRRNKKNWIEIYYKDNIIAYIPKKENSFYKCKRVKLKDEITEGCSINYKREDIKSPYELFQPLSGVLSDIKAKITFHVIENREENIMRVQEMEYRKEDADVKPLIFRKGEKFYITYEINGEEFMFSEVDNFKGKKGVILKAKKEDTWILPLFVVIAAGVYIVIVLAILEETGWLVGSALMAIPGIIIAFLVIFIIQIIRIIIIEIFNMIYKRL